MPVSSRIAQIYGYAVCLIAVVTLLVAGARFVDATFDRANPLQSTDYRYGPYDAALTSFEAFRATYPRGGEMTMRPTPVGAAGEPGAPDTLTTDELRERYEALRAERTSRVRFGAMRSLVKNGFLILLAIALFATHWLWVRERS